MEELLAMDNEHVVVAVNLRLPISLLDKIDHLTTEWELGSRAKTIETLLAKIFVE